VQTHEKAAALILINDESSYRQSLADDRLALFDRYRIADARRKLLYWQCQHAVHGRPLRFGVSASYGTSR
jgi:hypothetical protein